MRLRLTLSFILVMLVSVASVVIIARRNAANELQAFRFHAGAPGIESLVTVLENYYQAKQSWQGVETLIRSSARQTGMGRGPGGPGNTNGGMGAMMGQRLIVANANQEILADSIDPEPTGSLDASQRQRAIALQVAGETVGYLVPEGSVGFNQSDETTLLTRLNRAAMGAGLIAGSLSLLLALLLAYRLLHPVRELTLAAGQLAKGDLSQRVTVHGEDELAILGRAFNQMANSLQQAEESRRMMTADIAHELRNPLAVQQASLEAILDGLYPATAENLIPILEQSNLLTRLVDDLRTIALADSGQLSLERFPTNLQSLIQRVIERFKPQANAQQVEINFNTTGSIPTISIDPIRVEQILGNLLSNALRVTPISGYIEIQLNSSPAPQPTGRRGELPIPTVVRLTVRDNGPGIPPDSLPHIFERFYRLDRARSRAEGGTGLGLAIARQLARAHGGDLEAANHPEGGAMFTLTLPQSTT